MKLWIENVLNRRPCGIRMERSLLVWDMFQSHITDNSNAGLSSTDTDIAVILGGLISFLPSLDVSLSKPFKDDVRDEWDNWMLHGKNRSQKAMLTASLDVFCQFVIRAWGNVTTESVVMSLKKCGISGEIDDTEDELLYEDPN